MEFTIKSGSPEKQRSACVVVGVFDNRKPSLSADLIDRASGGYIGEIIRRGDMEGKLGSTLLLHNVRGTLADRVLLVGLGKERDFREREFRTAMRAAVRLLNETGSYEAVLYLTEEKVKRREVAWRVEHAVVVAMEAVYRFEQMKSQPTEVRRPLRKLTLSVPQRSDLAAGEAAAARGLAIAHGMDLTRDLGNLPANVCTPTYLADQARALARELNFKCEVLERPQIEELGRDEGLGRIVLLAGDGGEPRCSRCHERAVRRGDLGQQRDRAPAAPHHGCGGADQLGRRHRTGANGQIRGEIPQLGAAVDGDAGDGVDHVGEHAGPHEAVVHRLGLRHQVEREPTIVHAGGDAQTAGHGATGQLEVGHGRESIGVGVAGDVSASATRRRASR